ncbi:MAG TPA: hypothetical protein VF812_03725 [Ktedonobacterales bacterium]
MFGRVTSFTGVPERTDEALRYTDQVIRPAIKNLGALGMSTLVDRKTGKSLAITWWKDETAARGSAAEANQIRDQFKQALGADITDVHTYEVTLEEAAHQPSPRAARLTRAQGDISRIDELTRWTETQLLPAYRAQPGFSGWYTLTDRQTGKSLIISYWETEAAMTAAETLLNQSRGRGAQEMGLQFEPTERYELALEPAPVMEAQQRPEASPNV